MSTLDIIFSCDINHVIPLVTIINSIITNTSSSNKLRFNVVCDDTNKIMGKLQLLKKEHESDNFTFNCVSLKETLDREDFNFLSRFSYSEQVHANSIYNFCRFWFDKLFPELDYIIYLDIDMIIEGDIFELADFKFNDTHFFATVLGTISQEYRIKNMKIDQSILQEFKINKNNLAFNAGLYVTSLFHWRKYKILGQLKNIMMKRFRNQRLYQLGTQTPLNILFYNKVINITDSNWMVSTLGQVNVHPLAKESIKEKKAKCLHWTGNKKPWNSDRYKKIYLKYKLQSMNNSDNNIVGPFHSHPDFITVKSITRKNKKLEDGQYFLFNKGKFVSIVGSFFNNSTVYVEQYRSGVKIWEGMVRYWDNTGGVHGRRNNGEKSSPWCIGDQLLIHGPKFKESILNTLINSKLNLIDRKSVLTIIDGFRNEKGDNKYVNIDFTATISDCTIMNNQLLINSHILDLTKISTVIFNYNEDLMTFNNKWDQKLINRFNRVGVMIDLFKQISRLIKRSYPDIIIYQDPDKCFELGDKVLVYDRIKNIKDDLVTIPKYKKILNVNDVSSINFFPVIIKITNGSHSKDEQVCKSKGELIRAYNQYLKNKKNVFVVEFIDSYIKEINSKHSLRLMVTNNHVMEYYFRGGKDWNIHTKSQIKKDIKHTDLYYSKIYDQHKMSIENYLTKIHKIYGNGFYAYDLIYSTQKKKYYVCEIGLKIFDNTNYDYSKDYIDKLSFNEDRLVKYYKDLLVIKE